MGRLRFAIAICTFSSLLFLNQSYAQQRLPPSDTDLKAAYCVEYEKGILEKMQSLDSAASRSRSAEDQKIARDFMEDVSDKIDHLRLYLEPRLKYIDGKGLLAAFTRAKEDDARLDRSDMKACRANCLSESIKESRLAAGYQACVTACAPEIRARQAACGNLSWLPY